MCGIAGFIDKRLDEQSRPRVLESMLESIAHRGPDARGRHFDGNIALGHNRLSILDLSAEGNQPMCRGSAWIVFNGEIYNYIELRDLLKREHGMQFSTGTDTEVILAAYHVWGRDCVERFVGMWSFALWDTERRQLFCSRDRFGIKPFHYILQGERFYFGSEVKALYSCPLFSADVDEFQVLVGLQLGWNAWSDHTYYKEVKTLPAGHNLVWYEGGMVEVYSYWSLTTIQSSAYDAEDAVEGFRERFDESLRLHMRSDVEVGACLSGGLDSSSIVSRLCRLNPSQRMKAFTIYYEGNGGVDERPWVKEVLNAYPNVEGFTHTPSDDEVAEVFADALWHADVPLSGSSPFSQYFVMQLAAKQGIKVLLDGQGADEMLGGYMHSFYRLIGGLMVQGRFPKAIQEWDAHSRMQGFSLAKRTDSWLKSVLAGLRSEQHLYAFEYLNYLPFVGLDKSVPFSIADQQGSRLNRFLHTLTTVSSLPTLLQFEDRNSMAFSIESRVPFLDHRLVEYVFSLQDSCKINRGVTKQVLRQSMVGTLPEAIAGRKDKKGFVTPGEVRWLRGPLRFLLDQEFNSVDWLNRKQIAQLISQFRKGDDTHANLVWRLVVLRWWLEHGRSAPKG